MASVKANVEKLRKFMWRVDQNADKIQKISGVLVIKKREGGKIDVDGYSSMDYASFSGALNNGTFLTEETFRHEINKESLVKWNSVLADKEKGEEILRALAEENGVEAVIVNNRIYSIKNYELNRIIVEI
jgi:hypothetical protein